MPRCPYCESTEIYLSRTFDKPWHRLLLVAHARCHKCYECFFVPRWSVSRRRTDDGVSKLHQAHPAAPASRTAAARTASGAHAATIEDRHASRSST